MVSQPMAGLIRLQWWREALADIVAGRPPRAHPVVQDLHAALRDLAVTGTRLEQVIAARERELDDTPLASLAELEAHLDETTGTITRAAIEILGAPGPGSEEVARRVGIAVGFADLLRALPGDPQGRGLWLPAQELAARGLDREAVARGKADAGLAPVIAVLTGRAREHLRAARRARGAVPRPARAALLPGSLAGDYLERLRRAGHDVFAPALRRRPASAPLRLLWRHATGRF